MEIQYGELAGRQSPPSAVVADRKRAEQSLAAVVAVQQEIATAELDPQKVMRLIAERAQEMTGAAGAAIELIEGDDMVYRAAAGTATASLGLRIASATSLSGLCVRLGEALRCDDAATDRRVDRAACERVGARSMIVVPLYHERQIVGVLKVLSPQARAFREADSQVLQLMAGLLAATMSRSAAFASEQAKVSERTLALEQTEERFRLLVEGVEDYAIFMLDPEGRVASWNAGAERIKGYRAEEIIGQPIDRFFTAEQRAQGYPARQFAKALAEGRSKDEGWRLRKDGSRFWADVLTTALWNEDGQLRGFAKITRDVSERKLLEEQYRQAQKMEAVGQLAGGVAHDFNNLLTVISGYSQLLLGQLPTDDASREALQEIYKAGERAAGLTRQLLAFSRKQVLEPRILDLNDIVTEAAGMLRRLIGEDIELATVLGTGLGRVRVDPSQAEQIIMNLAVNARDAMPRGGKLTIATANVELDTSYARTHLEVEPGRYVVLSVGDTGSGMDDATKARIFEPFFTTKEMGKGTGLGLATVYGIVKQSGGSIDVHSELGQGTTFEIYLPALDEAAAAARPLVESAPVPRGTETVLLVEDEPAVRALGRAALEMHGYRVLEAGNGVQAIAISEGHPGTIELLITDVVMPGLGGRQLAEALRVDRPAMKVLFVSGYTDDALMGHGISRAEAGFLQKPFTPIALANRVREALDAVPGRDG